MFDIGNTESTSLAWLSFAGWYIPAKASPHLISLLNSLPIHFQR